jgi:hypothetical protein
MDQQRLKNERFNGPVLLHLNGKWPCGGHCHGSCSAQPCGRVGPWRGPLHFGLLGGKTQHIELPLHMGSHLPQIGFGYRRHRASPLLPLALSIGGKTHNALVSNAYLQEQSSANRRK